MSWNLIQGLFDGQGIVFWSAVTAVALGLTLLSVSIVFQVRKMLAKTRIRFKRPVRSRRVETAPTAAEPRITVTENGYQADVFVPSTATPAPDHAAVDPLLDSLLARLKVSADRLESIHTSLGHSSGGTTTPADSPLKATGEAVDYVYKSGRA